MNPQPRCIFVANGEVRAKQVRAFLAAAGIGSAERGESLRHTHGLTLNGLGAVQILVAQADAERARSLLESAESRLFQLGEDANVGRQTPRENGNECTDRSASPRERSTMRDANVRPSGYGRDEPADVAVSAQRSYLPPAGRDWLLWTYDPWFRLLGADAVRSALLAQMALETARRVLDIGCGTGSLVVLLKQRHARITVVGLEPDPAALAVARRKARRADVDVHLDRGFSDALPYADGSFDRVSCTFMLSLLPTPDKEAALREVRRVLRGAGRFILSIWSGCLRGALLCASFDPASGFGYAARSSSSR